MVVSNIEYELLPNGNCPICRTKNRVVQSDGVLYKGKITKVFSDRIVTWCKRCDRPVFDKK